MICGVGNSRTASLRSGDLKMLLHIDNYVIDTTGYDEEDLRKLLDELDTAMDKISEVLHLMEESRDRWSQK